MDDDTPKGELLNLIAWVTAGLIFLSICGLTWIAHNAAKTLDVEVVARIEAEAAERKTLTPSEYACIRQLAAGQQVSQPLHCASGTRSNPNVMSMPVAEVR